MTLDPVTIGGYIGFAFSALVATFQTFRGRRQEDRKLFADQLESTTKELIAAKQNVIDTLNEEVTAWKGRFETEHGEYVAYRADTHGQTNRAQSLILQLTNENAELKAKTDLTPILKFQGEQSDINTAVLSNLKQIGEGMGAMLKKLANIDLAEDEPVAT